MENKYILALDQGTTSSRTVLINEQGAIVGMEQREFAQIFPTSGWVEHDATEILETQLETLTTLLKKTGVRPSEIAGIGITNQRETTVVWNRYTGAPVYNAIVWQDKRTSDFCTQLKEKGLTEHVRKTTGLVIDSYFSGTKVHWILGNVPGAKELAAEGALLFGTIDTWLLWNMTEGKTHATDYSNASRTMLFDIQKLDWDPTMLEALKIPSNMLPEVCPSSHHFGDYELQGVKIPIAGIAGDQQAALFGQACFERGEAKNTYGTGCFMLLNTGEQLEYSQNGLLSTIAWGIGGKVYYALEGSVFVAGSAIQWLRDGLQIIQSASESAQYAQEVTGENPVYVVPAFAGLGAPYWDMYARGAVFGLTRDTGKAHLIKATLDSLAYQTKDVLKVMEKDAATHLSSLKVDGGACANDVLMQFQADLLDVQVERPEVIETTVMGAAYLAGICVGLWQWEHIAKNRKINRVFTPAIEAEKRTRLYAKWQKAVARTKDWLD